MTITRVWQAGAETGNNSEWDTSLTDISISSGTYYSGAYSFYGGWINVYSAQSIPATRQISTGHFMYPAANVNYDYLQIRAGTTALVSLNLAASQMDLKVGGVVKDSYYNLGSNEWQHIGIDTKIDSSSGWVKVYRDGSEILSFSGDTGNSDINNLLMGQVGGTGGRYTYFDDVYINDMTGESSSTAPRIKRFYPIIPDADGNYTQWTPSTGTSHYQMVDERPPDDDDTFLEAVTGSLVDSFDMTTFTLDTNEDIVAMIPFVLAKRGSTTEQIALGTRSSGTDSIGSDQDLSITYDYVWDRQTTGSLGSLWNQSYLDSVEVIIKSAGTY